MVCSSFNSEDEHPQPPLVLDMVWSENSDAHGSENHGPIDQLSQFLGDMHHVQTYPARYNIVDYISQIITVYSHEITFQSA